VYGPGMQPTKTPHRTLPIRTHPVTKAPPVWLSRQEAAARAGVSLRTIANCLADGRLTRHKDKLGRVKIDAAEVDALAFPTPTD
jgi:excisionase family DNA binding protein